jgi:hypothetical protein
MKTHSSEDNAVGWETAETPFIPFQDVIRKNTSHDLKRLKSSALVIGIIFGVALQSLSWATRTSSKSTLGDGRQSHVV